METSRLKSELERFVASAGEFWWWIHEDVHFDRSWTAFKESFEECPADLLATALRRHQDEPGWIWWKSLHPNEAPFDLNDGVACLHPLVRLSRTGAEAVLCGLRKGWTGHFECLVPTLVNLAGLQIEDIGGSGVFTPPGRINLWYDSRTWNWHPPVTHVPGKLHFPVPRQEQPFAPARISNNVVNPGRILFTSPVGQGTADLLPPLMEIFQNTGADILLLQYDQSELSVPSGTRSIREAGHKWQLAFKHLSPATLDPYDFIFYWDDDISAEGFDPRKFVEIMSMNRLEMAQPAILSQHGLSHPITRQQPCPAPFRSPDGDTITPVVGRLTNFVEIMAPVFTRSAWREFYGYLDPENRSGWGYDYIPLGRKGIVDILPVVHTRPVQSINGQSELDIARFTNSQGIFRHPAVNQGWLFG